MSALFLLFRATAPAMQARMARRTKGLLELLDWGRHADTPLDRTNERKENASVQKRLKGLGALATGTLEFRATGRVRPDRFHRPMANVPASCFGSVSPAYVISDKSERIDSLSILVYWLKWVWTKAARLSRPRQECLGVLSTGGAWGWEGG